MSLLDNLFTPVYLLYGAFILGGVILLYQEMMTHPFFATSAAMQNVGQALSILDYSMAFIAISFYIFSIYTASKVRTSIIFLPISIAFLIISTFLSAIYSNVFAEAFSQAGFANVLPAIPYTTMIVTNLPVLTFGSGVLIIFALYLRQQGFSGGGQRVAR